MGYERDQMLVLVSIILLVIIIIFLLKFRKPKEIVTSAQIVQSPISMGMG